MEKEAQSQHHSRNRRIKLDHQNLKIGVEPRENVGVWMRVSNGGAQKSGVVDVNLQKGPAS